MNVRIQNNIAYNPHSWKATQIQSTDTSSSSTLNGGKDGARVCRCTQSTAIAYCVTYPSKTKTQLVEINAPHNVLLVARWRWPTLLLPPIYLYKSGEYLICIIAVTVLHKNGAVNRVSSMQTRGSVVLHVFLPQKSRVALSAHHTFNRRIVHSLSRGQARRQKAAQTENYCSKPLTRDTGILHRKHYVHHSWVVYFPSLLQRVTSTQIRFPHGPFYNPLKNGNRIVFLVCFVET